MTTKRLTCCCLGRTGETCGDGAEWEIWDGIQPYFDHYIHACTEHVGALLTDRPEHRVYRISTTPSDVPHHAAPGPSVASRSSSGSGEAVHGEDVAHACAHAHGMGQEDGFRAGVEAAAREVASWAADAAHFNGRERKALDFAAKQIRALSSAPPSPSSGERVRVLEEALAEVVRRSGLPITPAVTGLPSSEAECAAAIEKCVRLVLDHIAEPARRALSSQGDGASEPKTKE